jgi:hypothetical protein
VNCFASGQSPAFLCYSGKKPARQPDLAVRERLNRRQQGVGLLFPVLQGKPTRRWSPEFGHSEG